MKTSLIITTYNWPEALNLILLSVRRQTKLPDEVIVADDGSRPETQQLIEAAAKDFPCPLRHIWQEDKGFRVSRIRNLAIDASVGDYLVLLDGDMVLQRNFMSDHINAAKKNYFVQGSRVLTTKCISEMLINTQKTEISFFSSGIARRRHTLRIPILAALWRKLTSGKSRSGIKTCNQG